MYPQELREKSPARLIYVPVTCSSENGALAEVEMAAKRVQSPRLEVTQPVHHQQQTCKERAHYGRSPGHEHGSSRAHTLSAKLAVYAVTLVFRLLGMIHDGRQASPPPLPVPFPASQQQHSGPTFAVALVGKIRDHPGPKQTQDEVARPEDHVHQRNPSGHLLFVATKARKTA